MAGPRYAEELRAVLGAAHAPAKAGLLAALRAPPEGAHWLVSELPRRPARDPSYREGRGLARRRRTLSHGPARNRFLLAIHHIELSAIDLAVIACLRGSGLPAAFHDDFLGIARDEARHAGLLAALLLSRGIAPGAEPVHHRLWEAALACRDLGEHLVVVPRVLEARGLDVAAGLLPRLGALDPEAQAVLEVIYRDEIGHVAIGTRWQRWWCQRAGLDPLQYFAAVLASHFPGQHPQPTALDRYGRAQAGFSAAELELLEGRDGV